MLITKTWHPTGAAPALIATIGSEKTKNSGYLHVLSPVISGACILLIVALVINNITPTGNILLTKNSPASSKEY